VLELELEAAAARGAATEAERQHGLSLTESARLRSELEAAYSERDRVSAEATRTLESRAADERARSERETNEVKRLVIELASAHRERDRIAADAAQALEARAAEEMARRERDANEVKRLARELEAATTALEHERQMVATRIDAALASETARCVAVLPTGSPYATLLGVGGGGAAAVIERLSADTAAETFKLREELEVAQAALADAEEVAYNAVADAAVAAREAALQPPPSTTGANGGGDSDQEERLAARFAALLPEGSRYAVLLNESETRLGLSDVEAVLYQMQADADAPRYANGSMFGDKEVKTTSTLVDLQAHTCCSLHSPAPLCLAVSLDYIQVRSCPPPPPIHTHTHLLTLVHFHICIAPTHLARSRCC
jgi:hypothetical protein